MKRSELIATYEKAERKNSDLLMQCNKEKQPQKYGQLEGAITCAKMGIEMLRLLQSLD